MKMLFAMSVFAILGATACNSGATKDNTSDTAKMNIKEESVSYGADTSNLKGFVAYNESSDSVRPGILVIPEWWGLNDYTRSRAKQLAELGYIAMAVDMYGNGKTAADPKEAQTMATPFYMNPALTRQYIDAAMAKLKSFKQTDTTKIAAIGYCFGGYVVLNAAKLGSDLDGVVSFHGSLAGVPPAKDLLKARVLVCHGLVDSFVPEAEVNAFKKGMDSVGATYSFKTYEGATHAFTNPDATATGKKFNMPIQYNAAADTASWNDMKQFFGTIF